MKRRKSKLCLMDEQGELDGRAVTCKCCSNLKLRVAGVRRSVQTAGHPARRQSSTAFHWPPVLIGKNLASHWHMIAEMAEYIYSLCSPQCRLQQVGSISMSFSNHSATSAFVTFTNGRLKRGLLDLLPHLPLDVICEVRFVR